jgi:GxxExxY protein
MDIEGAGRSILGAAIKVHSALGPGLLETAYQSCLAYELNKSGFKVECEVVLPVVYEKIHIDAGYRIDMLIEDCIVIENKAVEKILPILGYLLNWNVTLMKDGIRRLVNNI